MESWPIPQPIRAWKLLGTRWFPICHELRIETASSFWHRGVCPYRNCENSRDRGGLQPLSPQTHTAQGPQISCGRRGAGAYLEIIYQALKPIFSVTHHHCIPVYFYKHTRTRIYIYIYVYIYMTSIYIYIYILNFLLLPISWANNPSGEQAGKSQQINTHTQTDTHTQSWNEKPYAATISKPRMPKISLHMVQTTEKNKLPKANLV